MEKTKSAAEAMKNLETFYNGIPDESAELTFKYLTKMPQNKASEKKKSAKKPIKGKPDQNSKQASSHQGSGDDTDHSRRVEKDIRKDRLARSRGSEIGFLALLKSSLFPPLSIITTSFDERGQSQRKGIPHSNICALCDLYIYFFRHRCLVCGIVYCKKCVRKGMEEMLEGRKCVECLGRRFSQRYIGRAGKSSWCSVYPRRVKKQELIWAEKGASRTGEKSFSDPDPLNP